MPNDVVYVPFKKELYDDLIRFSDGKIDPAGLAVDRVEAWIDSNFVMGSDLGVDAWFSDLFGERFLEFAEKYAPEFVSELKQRETGLQDTLERRAPLIWKEVTVPAGSQVRMIYRGRQYYGVVRNGRIDDEEGEYSPSSWTWKITSTARNAWRDLWFKQPGSAEWVQADILRQRARRALRVQADGE